MSPIKQRVFKIGGAAPKSHTKLPTYQEVMHQTDELEQLRKDFLSFGQDPIPHTVAPKAALD